MEGHPGHHQHVPERSPSARGDAFLVRTFEEPTSKRPQARRNLSIHSSRLRTKPRERGKNIPPPIPSPSLTNPVLCVRRRFPTVGVDKQQRCLKSETLVPLGDRIPVLFTTEFLFPKTITFVSGRKKEKKKSGFEYFLFEIICVSKNGFCTTCASASTKNRADLLSQKGCIQACMAL